MKDDQVAQIADAIRNISHGGLSGPAGLESVAMALAGEGLHSSVSAAIGHLASALDDFTRAYEARTEVLRQAAKK